MQLQFLSEAIVLGVFGGLFGWLAGYLSSLMVEDLFHSQPCLRPRFLFLPDCFRRELEFFSALSRAQGIAIGPDSRAALRVIVTTFAQHILHLR